MTFLPVVAKKVEKVVGSGDHLEFFVATFPIG
jgi:hypothetical protein